jgi:hypothetical protein
MSEALAVQQRHIAIPECAMFSPCELVIAADCSQSEYERVMRAVCAIKTANALWVCDAALWAIERFGKKEGLKIAAEASGLGDAILYRHSLVAREFPSERRHADYSYIHFRRMMPFPRSWSYAFLECHAGEGLSSRTLRSLAVSEFGSDPTTGKAPKSRNVGIPDDLYARLRPYGNQKVSVLIIRILSDWLKNRTEVHKSDITAAAEPRPTYAERRQKQIADGAAPITAKPKKSAKLHRAWTECSGPTFVDGEGGAVAIKAGKHDATRFKTEAEASAADREFFEASGFHELVAYCEVCKAWHVRHVYNHPAAAQEKTADVLAG